MDPRLLQSGWDCAILIEQLAGDYNTIKTITIHNSQTGEVVQTLEASKFTYHSAWGSISPDGRRYVGCYTSTIPSEDGFRVWDLTTGRELFRFRADMEVVYSLEFSPDGKRIITASRDRTAKVWDAETGAELITLQTDDTVESASFSPDGTKVITASGTEARIYDGTPLPESKK